MNYAVLKTEVTTDPLGRGYSEMTDAEIAASLNDTVDRVVNKSSLSGDEMFGATVTAGFAALTAEKKAIWVSFCGRDSIDPFSTANVEFVKWVFGNTSDTVTALAALRVSTVSRATELGLGTVYPSQVTRAKVYHV